MDRFTLISFVLAIALDALFGDPRKMPHIVRLIGFLSQTIEQRITAAIGRSILSGTLFWLLVLSAVGVPYLILNAFFSSMSPWIAAIFDGLILFQCIAFKDLVKHLRDIKIGLRKNIETGRKKVAMIVGRDTDRMDEDAVCRAAIESGSENLNDAVIAPLFWFMLFGPLGAIFFRISNTLDAMVGHRNKKYETFGKFSARVDDVLNFIPARLCSLLIIGTSFLERYETLKPDAALHPSINAGWPEAAMAHRLGIIIGGTMYSDGQLVQTAEMNKDSRQPTTKDIESAIRVMNTAYKRMLATCTIILLFRVFL